MKNVSAALTVVVASLICAPTGWADPTLDAGPVQEPSPVRDACAQFGQALSLAAETYDEFAYATAGDGNVVDYADQKVWRTNVIGRTGLRESAYAVLSASRTPGLPPEVSSPMRSWSLHATKLLVIMGVRGGGDALNAAAEDLNADARAGQMACAQHGGLA